MFCYDKKLNGTFWVAFIIQNGLQNFERYLSLKMLFLTTLCELRRKPNGLLVFIGWLDPLGRLSFPTYPCLFFLMYNFRTYLEVSMYNAFTVHEIYCLKHLHNRERIQLKSVLQDIGRSCIIMTWYSFLLSMKT